MVGIWGFFWYTERKNMRVVIFGATGVLGRTLVQEFSDMGVLTPSRDEADFSVPDSIRDYLFRTRPDLVINAAAYNYGDEFENPAGYFSAMAINGRAVGHCGRAARLLGVPFIHYSTDRVFGRKESAGFREDDAPGPAERLSAHARSKLFGEKMLLGEGENFYLIRTAGLFGHSGGRLSIRKNPVDMVLGKEDIVIPADSSEVRAFTSASDLARATRELWNDQAPRGIYHLVNDGEATLYHIAQAAVRARGKDAIVRAAPEARSVLNSSMLLNTKRPKLRPWQEAVEEYVKKSF